MIWLAMLLAGPDSSAVIVAAITTGGLVVCALIAALVQINRVGKKTDQVQAQQGQLQIQLNGQMTALLERLDKAEEARRAAEVKLARYEEREHENPTP